MLGDVLAAVLFHFPTFAYQFPRLINEVRQAIAEHTISVALISRLILSCSSLLLISSAVASVAEVSRGGNAAVGNGLYIAGIATSALGAPILLGSFVQAWMGYRRQRNFSLRNNSLQCFVSQENVLQISERILLRGLNLLSAIAGQVLISTLGCIEFPASTNATVSSNITACTQPQITNATAAGESTAGNYSISLSLGLGALFAVNCLNLCLQRRPFEIASNPRNCLRHHGYRFDPNAANLQYLSLHADLNFGPQLVTALQGLGGRLRFAFNGRRLTLEQQLAFFEKFIESLSSAETRYLNVEQSSRSLEILQDIFKERESSIPYEIQITDQNLPAAIVSFFTYLQRQVRADCWCLRGNRVYERIIAILLKALAFREGILCMDPSS
ncbi:MAG: hypothetical protein ACRC9T_02510 [Vibrionaceae bacterium]